MSIRDCKLSRRCQASRVHAGLHNGVGIDFVSRHTRFLYDCATTRLLCAAGVFVISILIGGGKACAQPHDPVGSIELSWDPFVGSCEVLDAPGLRTIYVLHTTFGSGATASRFRIQAGPGMTMSYVSESPQLAQTVGNTQDGMAVCYGGACLTDDVLLVAMTYMAYGTSATCSQLLVVPHPDAEVVEAINCNLDLVRPFVQDIALSGIGQACGCPTPHSFLGTPRSFTCAPVAVEQTTWGAVKALYR